MRIGWRKLAQSAIQFALELRDLGVAPDMLVGLHGADRFTPLAAYRGVRNPGRHQRLARPRRTRRAGSGCRPRRSDFFAAAGRRPRLAAPGYLNSPDLTAA